MPEQGQANGGGGPLAGSEAPRAPSPATAPAISATPDGTTTVTTKRWRVFFAIYHNVTDGAFKRAAETWRDEVSATHRFNASADVFLMFETKTTADFRNSWKSVYDTANGERAVVVEGALFTHASIDSKHYDGLEFRDGTFRREDIHSLEPLPWDPHGVLTLTGCNTGNSHRDDHQDHAWCPAREFCNRQRITTIGQYGYAYFSTTKMAWSVFDAQTYKAGPLYLWTYHRKRNVKWHELETNNRITGIVFSP